MDPLSAKILLNHALHGGDLTWRAYTRPSTEHLRGAAERIAVFLEAKMPGTAASAFPLRKVASP